jgi:hypothetical protein
MSQNQPTNKRPKKFATEPGFVPKALRWSKKHFTFFDDEEVASFAEKRTTCLMPESCPMRWTTVVQLRPAGLKKLEFKTK